MLDNMILQDLLKLVKFMLLIKAKDEHTVSNTKKMGCFLVIFGII